MPAETATATAFQMMSKRPYTVGPDASLSEAAGLMLRENIGSLPVVDDAGRLVGLLTERMYQAAMAGMPKPFHLRSLKERTIVRIWGGYNDSPAAAADAVSELREARVRDIMLSNPPFVTEQATLTEVAATFFKSHLSHLPVVRERAVVGVIARHDLLRTVAGG